MKRIFLRLKQPLRNERGEITFFACFFVVGIVMLISFLLLYASIRITCINIRNGAKMELNNLSGTIYADTYRSQRETNFEEYLNTLYSSSDYADMLEATVAGGLDSKIPLSTEDYKVSNISLEFNVEDGRVAPNRIRRRFDTHIPHQKITTDTSEFKYYEIDEKGHVTMHKLYLDPFMDMCNGEILSYGIDQRPSAKNVMDALDKAIETTADCPYRRTFHSDQGWAYQMKAYSHRLKEERIFQPLCGEDGKIPSVRAYLRAAQQSRRGCC